MSGINDFISRLNRVRSTGKDRWIASCPTGNHVNGDRHPSLTVSIGNDGRVLVHCHSQECAIDEIASAVNMTVSELMPENVGFHRIKPMRMAVNPMDALCACRSDLTVCLVMMKDIQAGIVPDAATSLLMAKLIGRISMAIEFAGEVA